MEERLNADRRQLKRPLGILDDAHHRGGVGSGFEGLAKIFVVQKFCDIGEGVEVFLELALGNEEKHDEFHGLVVEGVKLHAAARAAEGTDNIVDEIGGSVGNANAETDAGAHRVFALFDDGGDLVAMFGFNFAARDEQIDQFVDGLPASGSAQVGFDLIFMEDIPKVHTPGEIWPEGPSHFNLNY